MGSKEGGCGGRPLRISFRRGSQLARSLRLASVGESHSRHGRSRCIMEGFRDTAEDHGLKKRREVSEIMDMSSKDGL